MKILSIFKNFNSGEYAVAHYNDVRIKYWGMRAVIFGGLWGLFFGSTFYWAFQIEPIFIADLMIRAMVAVLEASLIITGIIVLEARL